MTDLPVVEIGKLSEWTHEPNGPSIIFWRDPRDRIVATYRWQRRRRGDEPVPGPEHDRPIAELIEQIEPPRERHPVEVHNLTFAAAMLAFVERWGATPGLVVRFEELVDPDRGIFEARRIGTHLGTYRDPELAFRTVFQTGPTYTGSHSRWRDWFGPAAEAAWLRQKGPEILDRMGYS